MIRQHQDDGNDNASNEESKKTLFLSRNERHLLGDEIHIGLIFEILVQLDDVRVVLKLSKMQHMVSKREFRQVCEKQKRKQGINLRVSARYGLLSGSAPSF